MKDENDIICANCDYEPAEHECPICAYKFCYNCRPSDDGCLICGDNNEK